MKFSSLFLAASVCALLAFEPARACAGAGLTGAPILNRPIGARSSGMGRAFTAIPGEPESVMYNPAGPGFAPGGEVYLAYMNGFGGGSYGLAAVPLKFGNFVLTPAFLYYNSGAMNLRLSDGTRGAVTAELDKVGMLSAAYTPSRDLAVGFTLKVTSIDLAEAASASVKHYDLGALYRITDGLSAGAAALNNGESVKFEREGAPAPSTLRAGLAYKVELNPPNLLDKSADISYSDIVLTSDWSRTVKESGYYQAGFELNMKMPGAALLMSLRAGYLFERPEENMTFGFGIRKGPWNFGFGYEASKDLDARLPVSLSCEF